MNNWVELASIIVVIAGLALAAYLPQACWALSADLAGGALQRVRPIRPTHYC
jgi:hypothetical protein